MDKLKPVLNIVSTLNVTTKILSGCYCECSTIKALNPSVNIRTHNQTLPGLSQGGLGPEHRHAKMHMFNILLGIIPEHRPNERHQQNPGGAAQVKEDMVEHTGESKGGS